jgi:hypothetical protein
VGGSSAVALLAGALFAGASAVSCGNSARGAPAPNGGAPGAAVVRATDTQAAGKAAAPQSAPPQSAPLQSAPAPGAGPRKAIAGIRGFESLSTLVFEAKPQPPHTLRATYVFPDRVRWWIGVGEDKSLERQMRYRFGADVCAIDPQASKSHPLEGGARDEALAQMEMRRALMLWPAGFEWSAEGGSKTASLGALGALRADVKPGAEARPERIAWLGADKQVVDEFRAIAWREDGPKAWPTKLELWHAGTLVWRETIDAIDVSTRFIDSYFVPSDRRESSGGKAMEVGQVSPMDLPAHRRRRIALKPGATWDEAREKYQSLRTETSAELAARGLALDDKATFEVDAALAPTAVLLRLAPNAKAPGAELEKDWPLWRERPGLVTFVIGLSDAKSSRLQSLRAALPSDAAAGIPYVRFDPAKPGEHVLIVLPLEPRDG